MPQLTDFHEVRFPTDIAFGSSGGPERSTEIITLGSGREKRNQRWAQSRRRYDAGYGVKDLDQLHNVISFYEARRGPLYGFRFRDPLDWKSCGPLSTATMLDQTVGIGDGSMTEFQLVKNYGEGENPFQREIQKPESGSVSVAVEGNERFEGTDFTVDLATGIVSFLPSSIPASGEQITAGFHFDGPVRFANDQLTISLAAFSAGDIPSIPLMEIRL